MVRFKEYIALLWEEYNYQLLLVAATLASLIVESYLATSWSFWRLLPQLILIVCLFYFFVKSYLILKSTKPYPHVAFSLCIGKEEGWFESFAQKQQEEELSRKHIRWKDIRRIFKIHNTDWVFTSSKALKNNPDEWTDITGAAISHFWSLVKRIESVPIFHFFFTAPGSIVFAFGAHVGRKVPNKVYHFVNHTRLPYILVADSTKQDSAEKTILFNQRIPESNFQHIKIDRTPLNKGENIIITLDFTNHKISGPFPEEDTSCELIRIIHKQGIGHISLGYWMEIAHEIASTILPYCDAGKHIHIYVNTPLALAFLIGSIVGPIQGIFLCEYNIYAKELTKTIDLGSPKLQGLGRNFDPSL